MQQTLRADSNVQFMSAPAPSARRDKKLIVAAVAAASACALTVQPAMPSLQAATVSTEAVQLSAFQNPLAVWQQTIADTFANLQARGDDIKADGLPALLGSLSSSALRNELIGTLGNMVTNPLSILGGFADHSLPWADALVGGPLRTPGAIWDELMLLPPELETAVGHLVDGEFFKAYHTLNVWTVYALRGVTPLLGAFAIPGDIAEIFGAKKIAAVFDDLLTGRAAGGYANSLYSPVVAAMIAITETMDSIFDAVQTGDFVTAASDVINAPARVLNALLNGHTPRDYPEDYVAGIFSKAGDDHAGGPIDAFFVQIPKRIAAILAPSAADAEDESTPQVNSTEIAPTGDLVALNVGVATTEPSKAGLAKVRGATPQVAIVDRQVTTAVTEQVTTVDEPTLTLDDAPVTEEETNGGGAESSGLVTDDESGADSTGADAGSGADSGETAGTQTRTGKVSGKGTRLSMTRATPTKRTADSTPSGSVDSGGGNTSGGTKSGHTRSGHTKSAGNTSGGTKSGHTKSSDTKSGHTRSVDK